LFEGKEMNITIYTKLNCPNCVAAKALLKVKGLEYSEVDFERLTGEAKEWFEKTYPDVRQMPQIFIQGQRVGGLAGLQAALKELGL
jgi:glutaredoxin 3